jgi:hypothetical protein
MRAENMRISSDEVSKHQNKGEVKRLQPGPWHYSQPDGSSSTSDQKGKAPASDGLKDPHNRNVAQDSRPSREKEAKLMLEAEPENPVSAWKQALKQESPWVSMRLKEETIDAIAEFGVRKQQEAAMIREWEVGMAIEDDLNQKIAELPPKLQKRLFKFYATGTDEPDTWYSQLYNDIRNACQSVWESLVKKSDTSNSPLRDDELQTVSSISSPSEWFSPSNSPLRDNELQTVSSISSPSERFSPSNSPLRDNELQTVSSISSPSERFSPSNSPLKNNELQTISTIQSEPDHLHAMSSVQAETLASRPNQQSSTSSQEIDVTNQETDPASSRSKDLDKRSSVRDSNQNRKPTSRFNFSWSGLMKTCRSTKDTQVIEPAHISRQKPRQRKTRKEAGPS